MPPLNQETPKKPLDSSPVAVLVIVSTVQFLTPFMSSALGVALPAIGAEFEASAVALGLIQMGYILSASILLLPAGRYADIHGRKKIFITGTWIAIIATLGLPFSPNIRWLIFFRLGQGMGAAMITATSFAILTSVFPASKRGWAMGIIVSFVYAGLTLGPTLSGIIVTHMGWRWIFYLMLPLEIAALILTLTCLKGEWRDAKGETFDWQGSILFALSLTLMMVGLSRISQVSYAPGLLITGMVGLAIFFVLQKRTRNPLIDVHLLTSNLTFTLSNIATLINYAASFGIIFLFSLYLQYTKGFSPQSAGFILVVQPATQMLLAPIAGRLSDHYQPKRIATMGMACCGVGLFLASFIEPQTSLGMILFILILLGIGFGFFSSPNMTAIMSSVAPKYYGTASSMVATMRTQGMLISMAIVMLVMSAFLGDQAVSAHNMNDFIGSMQLSLRIFSVMSLMGVGLSMK